MSEPVHIADSMLKFMRLDIVQLTVLIEEMEHLRGGDMDMELAAARAALKLQNDRARAGLSVMEKRSLVEERKHEH
jgi:hypothetical protein